MTAVLTAEPSIVDALSRLGPVATGLAAVVALAIGVLTVVQRARADRRDQWWKRARWAFDLMASEDRDGAARGYAALFYLTTSTLAGGDEQRLLRAVSFVEWEILKNSAPERSPTDEGEPDDDDTAGQGPRAREDVRRVRRSSEEQEPLSAAPGHQLSPRPGEPAVGD